jgi:hypothetical protein
MNEPRYIDSNNLINSLSDGNSLERQFDSTTPNQATTLSDIFEDVGNFFTNTGKSAENANKITERLDKNLEKSFPYILAAGIIFGAMALSQTVKNVQEIQKNAK